MLASNKSVCKLNRKRKSEYSVYDINNEEEKEYKRKRHKPLNMKNQSDDQELWNEIYQKLFENELEIIENNMQHNENIDMNIDA